MAVTDQQIRTCLKEMAAEAEPPADLAERLWQRLGVQESSEWKKGAKDRTPRAG